MAAVGRHRKSNPLWNILYIGVAAVLLGTVAALLIAVGLGFILL